MSQKKFEEKIDNSKVDREDSSTVRKFWKKASIILVILFVFAIGYIILDKQSEEKIPEPFVRYHLGMFIANMRGISSDPVMVRKNLEYAYAVTSHKGKKQLDKIIKDLNLEDKFEQKILVSPNISSIKKKNKTLYTVEWTETEYQNSKILLVANFEGFFRLEFLKMEINDNPFPMNPAGIFVNNIVMNKISKPNLDS